MTLLDLAFAFFLPMAWVLHWLLPRRASVQNLVLLIASGVFYATWSWQLLLLLLAGTVVDHAIAGRLSFPNGSTPGGSLTQRRVLLATSLSLSLGTLAFFKYAGFFQESLARLAALLGADPAGPAIQIGLPLGISYYTLTRVGYMIDVYTGRIEASSSWVRFALFASFFPQLIAGPITRGNELLPQFASPRRLRAAALGRGAGAYLLGFIFKGYVANWIGPTYVDPVFAAPAAYAGPALALAVWAYALQVFADFAGYSLLAIGVGLFFGIDLPENFRRPFLARNVREFWNRWHITLNRWLFDHLYWPSVAGQGWLRGRLDLGFVLVFLLSGIWHGAAWTFVLWGLFHGLALVVHRRWDEFWKSLCRKDRIWVARRRTRSYALASWALTQSAFLVSLVFFRANSLGQVGEIARGLLRPDGEQLHLLSFHLAVVLGILALHHALEFRPGQRLGTWFFQLPGPVRGVAYGLVIVFLFLFAPLGAGAFIYGGF